MERQKDLSAISDTEFASLQEKIDVEKWLASEKAGRDLCGAMTWCVYCVKAETYPCAKAQFREKMAEALSEIRYDLSDQLEEEKQARESEKETEEVIREDVAEEVALSDIISETSGEEKSAAPDGYELVTRYRRSFRSRLIQEAPIQDVYTEVKNTLLGYGGVKSRMCRSGENFRANGEKIAKFVITGKKLSVFLALDPKEFENSNYRFEDVSDKKSHRETPLRVKITSRRSLKQVKELLGILAAKNGLPEVGCIYTDFHFPYKSDDVLIRAGLIKPYLSLVRKKNN